MIVKITDASGFNWDIFDNRRDAGNPHINVLYPNVNDAEAAYSSTQGYDFLANGFKVKDSSNGHNASGYTYIYAAFAEYPFKNGNAAIYNIN